MSTIEMCSSSNSTFGSPEKWGSLTILCVQNMFKDGWPDSCEP